MGQPQFRLSKTALVFQASCMAPHTSCTLLVAHLCTYDGEQINGQWEAISAIHIVVLIVAFTKFILDIASSIVPCVAH